MTTIVPLSLPPPPSLHLLASPPPRPPTLRGSSAPTNPLHRRDCSAAVPAPLSDARQPNQQPHRCVPHLSNDLLLMLYQLTLQTGPLFLLTLLLPPLLRLASSTPRLPFLRPSCVTNPLDATAVCNPGRSAQVERVQQGVGRIYGVRSFERVAAEFFCC